MENTSETLKTEKPASGGNLNRILLALLLLVVGGLAIMNENLLDIPSWLLTWKVLLIVIGFYRLFEKRSADLFGLVLITVGGYFLVQDIDPLLIGRLHLWPFILIAVAIYLLFGKKPNFSKGQFTKKRWKEHYYNQHYTSPKNPFHSGDVVEGEVLNANLFGAATKKKVTSSLFRGGQINCLMGGAEIDFRDTTIVGKTYFELNVMWGGIELRIPSDWEVIVDQSTIFGGLEDNRHASNTPTEGPKKILILTGAILMGGVEITN